MQKARAARKRARVMQSVTSTAAAQISTYLGQCRDFAEAGATATDQALHHKLDQLLASADKACEEILLDAEAARMHVKETNALYQTLEREVTAFSTEATAVCAQYTKEDREARAECERLRAAALEGVRKAVAGSSRGEEREPGRKAEKSKLLKALREL